MAVSSIPRDSSRRGHTNISDQKIGNAIPHVQEILKQSSANVKLIDIEKIGPKLTKDNRIMFNRLVIPDERVKELAQNIKVFYEKGLFKERKGLEHPILLHMKEEGGSKKYEIISGHIRLEAFKYLKESAIPAYVITDLSDTDVRMIRTVENYLKDGFNDYELVYSILDGLAAHLNRPYIPTERFSKLVRRVRDFDTLKKVTNEDIQAHAALNEILYNLGNKMSIHSLIKKIPILKMEENLLDAVKNKDMSFEVATLLDKTKNKNITTEILSKIKAGELNNSYDDIKKYISSLKNKKEKRITPASQVREMASFFNAKAIESLPKDQQIDFEEKFNKILEDLKKLSKAYNISN